MITNEMTHEGTTDILEEKRIIFIKKTYTHLAFAILAFIILESIFLNWSVTRQLAATMLGGRFSWFIVLAAFMGVGYIADKWARSSKSKEMQYMGLGLYILIEAIIFMPLLLVARYYSNGNSMIGQAGLVSIGMFAGLSYIAFFSKKDFSFLSGILSVGSFLALAVIGASLLFGFNLGLLFSVIMVGLASVAILYSTSNLLRHYNTDQHVAASLSLFASVMLLFWYVLRIFMSFDD